MKWIDVVLSVIVIIVYFYALSEIEHCNEDFLVGSLLVALFILFTGRAILGFRR